MFPYWNPAQEILVDMWELYSTYHRVKRPQVEVDANLKHLQMDQNDDYFENLFFIFLLYAQLYAYISDTHGTCVSFIHGPTRMLLSGYYL